LDESTSALDEASEENIYQLCEKQQTTLITIGHRNTLFKFHKQHLDVRSLASF